MVEANCRAVALKIRQRRIDEGGAEPLLRDQWTASAAATGERLSNDGARERSRCLGRINVERSEKDRAYKPFVERTFAGDNLAEFLARPCAQQTGKRQIVE